MISTETTHLCHLKISKSNLTCLIQYLQLRSSVGSVFGLRREEEEDNKVQEFLNSPHMLHSASIFYRKMSNTQTRLFESLKLIWQKDIVGEIKKDVWKDVISNECWATRDARSKLTHYKTVRRYYLTPLKLFKTGITQDNRCWKCKKEEGTFLHALWGRPMVLPIWRMVLKNLAGWLKKYENPHNYVSWWTERLCHQASLRQSLDWR